MLGNVYGARIAAAGYSVTIVARGDCLSELQRGPILISSDASGVTTAAAVAAVPNLEPDDDYDWLYGQTRSTIFFPTSQPTAA